MTPVRKMNVLGYDRPGRPATSFLASSTEKALAKGDATTNKVDPTDSAMLTARRKRVRERANLMACPATRPYGCVGSVDLIRDGLHDMPAGERGKGSLFNSGLPDGRRYAVELVPPYQQVDDVRRAAGTSRATDMRLVIRGPVSSPTLRRVPVLSRDVVVEAKVRFSQQEAPSSRRLAGRRGSAAGLSPPSIEPCRSWPPN